MSEYRHINTKRADGVYITFKRVISGSDDDPRGYLFQDPDYQEEDQKRLDAYYRGEWCFIGVQAEAHILIVKNGVGTMHTMTSAGLWAIEDDSGEDYLNSVYAEEVAELKSDIAALGSGPLFYETELKKVETA